MKISRYGGRQFKGGSGDSSERSAIFRKSYKVGEIIQGILLKWEHEKLGWVQIEDQKLLANIQTSPSPGDTLIFLVQQLYPDIILKELSRDDLNANGVYLNPTDVTRQFVTKRAAFESEARSVFNDIQKNKIASAAERLKLFMVLLDQKPEYLKMFLETLKCVTDLNSILKSTKLFYMPWLVPSAHNQEIVLKVKEDTDNPDNSFYELLYALDLPPSRPARFRIMYKKPQCGFKLLADDQNLKALLAGNFEENFPEFIGVERIPQQSAGGFLSELLNAS
ncbi:hypothetical protein [Maridesulfovibrio hydrothermalis]|uniref:Uncharacterized protein n=1 Tax=Maridesulfovibrio hydrothermalis AM13 = DSM 14728 TaxID=1121451 RepID=L0RDV9_9BACT|nr:hypothetical protein [Maridesulfovibrio hydrothermalis]CCO24963.1 conserved protein of unknown function [Maridesulfovibrio hydrothermalis AM13 = DSM 14728]